MIPPNQLDQYNGLTQLTGYTDRAGACYLEDDKRIWVTTETLKQRVAIKRSIPDKKWSTTQYGKKCDIILLFDKVVLNPIQYGPHATDNNETHVVLIAEIRLHKFSYKGFMHFCNAYVFDDKQKNIIRNFYTTHYQNME